MTASEAEKRVIAVPDLEAELFAAIRQLKVQKFMAAGMKIAQAGIHADMEIAAYRTDFEARTTRAALEPLPSPGDAQSAPLNADTLRSDVTRQEAEAEQRRDLALADLLAEFPEHTPTDLEFAGQPICEVHHYSAEQVHSAIRRAWASAGAIGFERGQERMRKRTAAYAGQCEEEDSCMPTFVDGADIAEGIRNMELETLDV